MLPRGPHPAGAPGWAGLHVMAPARTAPAARTAAAAGCHPAVPRLQSDTAAAGLCLRRPGCRQLDPACARPAAGSWTRLAQARLQAAGPSQAGRHLPLRPFCPKPKRCSRLGLRCSSRATLLGGCPSDALLWEPMPTLSPACCRRCCRRSFSSLSRTFFSASCAASLATCTLTPVGTAGHVAGHRPHTCMAWRC